VLRVMVKQARPGMTLARAIINPRVPETTLLSAGSALTAQHIARLHEMGVFDCWVRYPGLDFLDDMFSPALSQQQQKMCETLKTSFHAQAMRTDNKLPVNQYREVVTGLVDAILNNPRNMAFFSDIAGVDDAMMRHASEVAYLGVMLGLKLDGYLIEQRKRLAGHHAKDVVNLGIGCMLHDLGEAQMKTDQKESRKNWMQLHDPQSGADTKTWREHVQLGYATVRSQLEPSAAIVVLNHHQHFDGSGFPEGISGAPQAGGQIHVYARIATAADTFQHLLRPDGMLLPTVAALWRLQQEPYRKWLDPVVLEALLAVVPAFMPGMVVQLTDRRNAVVTKASPETPCYPEVQILGDFDGEDTAEREVVDLSKEAKLEVAFVDGVDVGAFMYGPRQKKEKAKTEKLAAVA
jgi:HD-GYP domain-containing protein (c-di-GMP phosphodiesterase class II)